MPDTRPETARCDQCGAEYIERVYWQRFCSKECRLLYHQERRRKALKQLKENENAV